MHIYSAMPKIINPPLNPAYAYVYTCVCVYILYIYTYICVCVYNRKWDNYKPPSIENNRRPSFFLTPLILVYFGAYGINCEILEQTYKYEAR